MIGFGSLGQFPTYYAFTQELSARRMGNVTGVLSFAFWLSYGRRFPARSAPGLTARARFSQVMFVAGLLPLVGFCAIFSCSGMGRHGARPDDLTPRLGSKIAEDD